MTDDEDRSLEDLQRVKVMLEIEKLRQDMNLNQRKFDADMLAQNQRMDIERRRDRWFLPLSFLAGGAGVLAAAAAMGKLFFGG